MKKESLYKVVSHLLSPPRGILAADESSKTCDMRFEELGIAKTLETRRQYRQLLFTTPNFAKYVSGVILFEETIRQKNDSGVLFVDLFNKTGVIPGIKVDGGLVPFDNFPDVYIIEIRNVNKKGYIRHIGARFPS